MLLDHRPGGIEHAYLVDFGVARAVTPRAAITSAGAVVGTPAYLAPELGEGRRSDHRVDVYARVVTLFQLLAGEPEERWSTAGELAAGGRLAVDTGGRTPAAHLGRPPRRLESVAPTRCRSATAALLSGLPCDRRRGRVSTIPDLTRCT